MLRGPVKSEDAAFGASLVGEADEKSHPWICSVDLLGLLALSSLPPLSIPTPLCFLPPSLPLLRAKPHPEVATV